VRWRNLAVAIIIAAIILVLGLIVLGLTGEVLVDALWFSEIGYRDIFWTVVSAKAALAAAAFVICATFLGINGIVAMRWAAPSAAGAQRQAFDWDSVQVRAGLDLQALLRAHQALCLVVAAGILAGLFAAVEVSNWEVFLRFIYQVPYGQNDPTFGKDIGFYLFSLPAYVAIKNGMIGTLILAALVAGAIYLIHGDIDFDKRPRSISPSVLAHGSALLGLFFLVKAWSYTLDRFLLLYDDNGVVVGANYTDVTIVKALLWGVALVAVLGALISSTNLWAGGYRRPVAAAALVFTTSLLLLDIFPALFERLFVKPYELQLERPYIQQNITLTQRAYNLDQITVKSFSAEQNLDRQSLQANQPTIDNIRLWDWQPLMDTYAQLQEIRTYYKFHDVDLDRYWLGGSYQQVTLSARELDPELLPANARTWVNRHLLFTHGIGAIMSPVTRKNAEGLPLFYLRDIPPAATGGPTILEPRIYFGELPDSYVVVKTTTPEFDYPNGKDNVYGTYRGTGGVAIGGFARRALFTWYFADVNLMLSRYIGPDSRILFRRNIADRVAAIAPFLELDRDPYLVISNGRLFWIQDAYTTSEYFPYAQPLPNRPINYIRNAVKVVIDAYDGSVDFYLIDPADPIAATLRRIFPSLFKTFEAMPEDLKKHIRYPEDLFHIQALMYQAYHMDSPEVFYNREDLWQFPRQPDHLVPTMAPYYMIMRLPGESQAEFILMLPMVPSQRENMIAWLAARCDPPNYGKLIAYAFPKDKLVYGPFQIEARINQDTNISQALSLWNQLGSRVIRGNLLVIPIENSLLYVSPLYLRAETGQLPELKRVIAAYNDRVVMEETLGEALAALFKEPEMVGSGAAPGPTTGTDRTRDALGHYNRAMGALKEGDWAGFGAELEKLRSTLEGHGKP
jgi:uncharacterized protein